MPPPLRATRPTPTAQKDSAFQAGRVFLPPPPVPEGACRGCEAVLRGGTPNNGRLLIAPTLPPHRAATRFECVRLLAFSSRSRPRKRGPKPSPLSKSKLAFSSGEGGPQSRWSIHVVDEENPNIAVRWEIAPTRRDGMSVAAMCGGISRKRTVEDACPYGLRASASCGYLP